MVIINRRDYFIGFAAQIIFLPALIGSLIPDSSMPSETRWVLFGLGIWFACSYISLVILFGLGIFKRLHITESGILWKNLKGKREILWQEVKNIEYVSVKAPKSSFHYYMRIVGNNKLVVSFELDFERATELSSIISEDWILASIKAQQLMPKDQDI